MSVALLPISLKKYKGYLELAVQHRHVVDVGPTVSYHCRLFALEAVAEHMSTLDKAEKEWVLTLMGELEAEKKRLSPSELDRTDATTALLQCARALFSKADTADRALDMSLATAKNYKASVAMFTVAHNFSTSDPILLPDMQHAIQYATERFTEIVTAAREHRPPKAPMPPEGEDPPLPSPPPSGRSHETILPEAGTTPIPDGVDGGSAGAATSDAGAAAGSSKEGELTASPLFPQGHTPSRGDLGKAYNQINAAVEELKVADVGNARTTIAQAIATLVGADSTAYGRAMSRTEPKNNAFWGSLNFLGLGSMFGDETKNLAAPSSLDA